jgi:hypothetical protein
MVQERMGHSSSVMTSDRYGHLFPRGDDGAELATAEADGAQGVQMTTNVTVQVWGKPHEISVYQKSKSVWIAVGTYMDEQIEVKGFELRLRSQALARGGDLPG